MCLSSKICKYYVVVWSQKKGEKSKKIKNHKKAQNISVLPFKKSLVLVISYAVVINNQFKHIFPKKGDYAKSLLKINDNKIYLQKVGRPKILCFFWVRATWLWLSQKDWIDRKMARKGMTVFLHRLPKLRSDLTSFARKGSLTVASQCGNASSSTDCLADLQKNARFSLLNRQSSNARTNKRTNGWRSTRNVCQQHHVTQLNANLNVRN